jgi:hypothetical protein
MRIAALSLVLLIASSPLHAQQDAQAIAEGRRALDQAKDCDGALAALHEVSTQGRRDPAWIFYMAKSLECASNLRPALIYYQKYDTLIPNQVEVVKKIRDLRGRSQKVDRELADAGRATLRAIELMKRSNETMQRMRELFARSHTGSGESPAYRFTVIESALCTVALESPLKNLEFKLATVNEVKLGLRSKPDDPHSVIVNTYPRYDIQRRERFRVEDSFHTSNVSSELFFFETSDLAQQFSSTLDEARGVCSAKLERSYPEYVQQATALMHTGDTQAATAFFQFLVSRASGPEENNSVCWLGALAGLGTVVLPACDQAVTQAQSADDISRSRNRRGLARAGSGNLNGAAEDFTAFVESASSQRHAAEVDQRRVWIESLRKGINPFTPGLLDELRAE